MGEINWSLCLTKFKKKESFLVHVHLQVSLQLKLFSGRAVAVNFDPERSTFWNDGIKHYIATLNAQETGGNNSF